MTDSKQITILSELPVSTLEYFRLALNIAYQTDPYGRENCATICRLVNLALEQKQENYWTGYEELDDDNQMAFI